MATARDTYITEQLATEGMADTAANRKKLGKRYDQIYLGGKKDDWRTYFKLQFPQLGDMLDGADGEKNARAIFGDLIDLFVEIATNPAGFDLTSDAGIQAFYRRVDEHSTQSKPRQTKPNMTLLIPQKKNAFWLGRGLRFLLNTLLPN
jgi:hypothetical protein